MQDRHAAYFGGIAEVAYAEFWGPRQGVWLSRLETEHDNLRAALTRLAASGQDEALVRMAGALGAFWLYRGHAAEGRSTLEQVLARSRTSEVAPATLGRALLRLASVLAEQGVFDRADELLRQVRSIRRDLGDRRELGEVISWMGAVAEYRGDDALALRYYDESYAVIRETHDDSLISYALANLSDTAYRLGDFATAARQGREALAAARAADDAVSTIVALGVTAQVDLVEGRIEDAVAAVDESLTLSVHIGYQSGIANSIGAFAAVASATSQLVLAAKLLAAAQGVRESAGIHRSLNHRLIEDTLSAVRHQLDETAFAEAWATGQALTLTETIDLAHSMMTKPGRG
jgi:tetratricopeptide (TPR) repeat protein